MPKKGQDARSKNKSTQDDHLESGRVPVVQERRSDFGWLQEYVMIWHAQGLGSTEISVMLLKSCGIFLSKAKIEEMIERVMPGFMAWQSRGLLPMYEQVCIIELGVRMKKVCCKKACVLLGTEPSGHMEALGLWLTEDPDKGFWKGVLSELQPRGLQEVGIIASRAHEALLPGIKGIFPNARVLLCQNCPRAEVFAEITAERKREHDQAERQMDDERLSYINHIRRLHASLQKVSRPEKPFSSDDAILKALFWRVMEWEASVVQEFDGGAAVAMESLFSMRKAVL